MSTCIEFFGLDTQTALNVIIIIWRMKRLSGYCSCSHAYCLQVLMDEGLSEYVEDPSVVHVTENEMAEDLQLPDLEVCMAADQQFVLHPATTGSRLPRPASGQL